MEIFRGTKRCDSRLQCCYFFVVVLVLGDVPVQLLPVVVVVAVVYFLYKQRVLDCLPFQVLSWKLDTLKVNQSAESYLVLHRFGGVNSFISKMFQVFVSFLNIRK